MTQSTDVKPAVEKPAVSAAVIVHEGRVLLVRRRVKEGELSWQFPAGAVEPGETPAAAAVRETKEEAGLVVAEAKPLGDRVHPKTGRRMYYTACDVVSGDAYVADAEELDQVAWVTHAELKEYVPYGFFEPVQEYLDAAIGRN
ncbi:NUDIX hydrolase [Amycolatopsis sp. NPDC004368]